MDTPVNKFEKVVPGIKYHMTVTEQFMSAIDLPKSEYMEASNKLSEAMAKAEAETVQGDDQLATRLLVQHIQKVIEDDESVRKVAACMTIASIAVGISIQLNQQDTDRATN